MPIRIPTELRVISQDEFYRLNHRLLGIVFDIHNEFGRFLDESLFKHEIAARCHSAELAPVEAEIHIQVSHDTFHKDYFLDLLFCHGLLLEAKAAESLNRVHRAQALNYLLLLGLQHGTLVNLRPDRVQHEFVSTGLTPERRRDIQVVEENWRELNERSALLRQRFMEVLADWGAFLEIGLYREAIVYFLGGTDAVIRPIPIYSNSHLLGQQKLHLLTPDISFTLTAVTEGRELFQEHCLRFLSHTRLKAMQWVNLNHHRIEFTTLENRAK